MQQELVDKIKNNPKYHELVSKRSRFAWILSIIMLVIYYAFIMVIAFSPQTLAMKISEASVITIGIPIGILIIISAFMLTGIYVWRANGEFDNLTKQIKEGLK
ncbi:MAG: DUF485 domain-containing protein [Candidatus Parabeggiatoa sp. nov. 3]|jgi:uncharacterized membrane protein (DUF485 family)|nr:MAG: DUF485 domain-containing protein [Gammaproteobacteria bacterium]RKZ67058.1 MAG: DUF485 domain-containing protein [Gammaproteobacteria bacterium]RKZ82965.1 MAG: DUF485 domain-containing protein [Gammaproteobacteria bacterium]HEW97955.1 DUF485 domain-containing protein [Beggiatoa sp.]